MANEVIHGQPMADYLATAAVSKSLLTTLAQECPKAAWADSWLNPHRKNESSKPMNIGTLVHSMVLEGNDGRVVCVNPEDYPAENGNIPQGWTNKAIREARQTIEASGDIAVLKSDYQNAAKVRDAIRRYIEPLAGGPGICKNIWEAFQPDGGDPEVTLLWEQNGVRCRARPDMLHRKQRVIVDLKTTATSANPAAWGRTQLTGQHGYMSAVFYSMAVKAIYGVDTSYVFLVAEVEPPYLCSLVGVSAEAMQLGEEKIMAALELWKRCMDTGQWPGYPPTVAYPELPVYMAYEWEERQPGYEYTYQQMFGGRQ